MKRVTRMIRERRDDDLAVCVTLLGQVHVAERYPINWPDDPCAWLTPPGTVTAWVATLDGEVVGHLCLTRKGDVPAAMTLERLFVSPAAAGAGVGKGLVIHASEWAAQRRSRLTLDVAENCARAIALYHRLGWKLTGRTPIGWGQGHAHDLLHFEAPSG